MRYDTPTYVAILLWPFCDGIYEISKCATAYAQILNPRRMWQVRIWSLTTAFVAQIFMKTPVQKFLEIPGK